MSSGGDGGGAGDTSGADESTGYGSVGTPGGAPGASAPGGAVGGAATGGGIGAATSSPGMSAVGGGPVAAAEAIAASNAAAQEAAFGGAHTLGQTTTGPAPGLGAFHSFLTTPIGPDLGRLSVTPGRALASLVTAPMGPLGMVFGGLTGLANLAGLEGINESAADAVAAQEAATNEMGGDYAPYMEPRPPLGSAMMAKHNPGGGLYGVAAPRSGLMG